jgi:hypothetical protein
VMAVIEHKFDVKHDSLEDIVAGKVTVLAPNEKLIKAWPGSREENLKVGVACQIGMIMGAFDVGKEGTSLTDLFPQIKTVKVEEYLKLCFKQ